MEEIILNQQTFFNSGKTLDIDFRLKNLEKLKQLILANETKLLDALKADLNKSHFEGYETELMLVLEEIHYFKKNLKKLAKPTKVKTPITNFIGKSKIYKEPYGVTLIMSPWNYPLQLTLVPVIGAIASGNTCIIKPSNYSPNTSQVIRELINENFDSGFLKVVTGGRKENEYLLNLPFDFIFFTGSINVGKIVMEKASKNLTPIVLELGGKSPVIIDKTANLELSAKRLMWGKLVNAGQTCIAPDYCLIEESIKDEFIKLCIKYAKEFYPTYEDYPKIINDKHYERLLNLIEKENIVIHSKNDETRQIYPTILDNITLDSKVMQEEIFGPILPFITIKNIDEAISIIKKGPKPLALYLFTTDKNTSEKILKNVSFGGGCINDTIMHIANANLPFGGVGYSGMGSYHAKKSFDTFTHSKSILNKSLAFDLKVRYAPYKDKIKLLKKLAKK